MEFKLISVRTSLCAGHFGVRFLGRNELAAQFIVLIEF